MVRAKRPRRVMPMDVAVGGVAARDVMMCPGGVSAAAVAVQMMVMASAAVGALMLERLWGSRGR